MVLESIETIIALLASLIVLAVIAQRFNFPYPILLVFAGLAIAAIPGLPDFTVDPDVVFVVFLPPLIFSSAWLFPWDEFRANFRRIMFMALILVLLTITTVAFSSYWLIPGLTLAAAFVLGAVVSPPDAVAATAILKNVGLPRRVENVLEGESLVNDASSLVAYQVAVAAVVTGSFSWRSAGLDFIWMSVVGIAVGLLLAVLVERFCKLITDSSVEITLLFIMPFIAYLGAEAAEASGILAVVSLGMYLGHRKFGFMTTDSRLQSNTFWTIVTFVLNGVVFLLIGLEIPIVVSVLLDKMEVWQMVLYAGTICLVVIASRFLWILAVTRIFRGWLSPFNFDMDQLSKKELVVLSWAGMRGVVSLAAALAIPRLTDANEEFPDREIILFVCCAVIFTTLTLNGLTLPMLVRRLGVQEERNPEDELRLRQGMLKHTLAYIDGRIASESEQWVIDDLARLRAHTKDRLEAVESRIDAKGRKKALAPHFEFQLFIDVMEEQRRYLREAQLGGEISDYLRTTVEHDIDLEEHRVRKIAERL